MRRVFIIIISALVAGGLAAPDPVAAQEAVVHAQVVSAGAGAAANNGHFLKSTIGATGANRAVSDEATISAGFLSQAFPPSGSVASIIANSDVAITDEDTSVTLRPLENDDPAGGVLSIVSFTQPDHGTVDQSSDHELTYTPDPDYNGRDRFTYTASHSAFAPSTADVGITIRPVNDAPVFDSTPVTGADAGESYAYVVEISDVDGDTIVVTASTIPAWLRFGDNGDGTAALSGVPTNADIGRHEVVLKAGDGSAVVEQAFSITVAEGVPGAPELISPADGSMDLPEDVTLIWSETAGAGSYELQVSSSGSFATSLVDTTGIDAPTWQLTGLDAGTTYYWRVRAVNGVGASAFAGPWQFGTRTNVAAEDEELPRAYRLDQNYPNPFNPSTTIAFDLPVASHVRLRLYDVFGRAVRTLADKPYAAGRHELTVSARDLASGHYFYRITAGDFRAVRRMSLVK